MRSIRLVSNAVFATQEAPHEFLGGTELGFRQGELDGACGPYAVMTAMVAGGLISRQHAKDAWNQMPDGRTKFARAIKDLPPLVQDGTNSAQLIELITSIEDFTYHRVRSRPRVLADANNLTIRGRALLPLVAEALATSDMPVILRLDWERSDGDPHWVVAIGYEESKRGVADHLLVIDPGFDLAPVQLWNGVLSCRVAKRGTKPYLYWTGCRQDDESPCQIGEAIVLA